MYRVGDVVENIKTNELSYEGYGVVRLENHTIFVENLLPDEIADIVIKKTNSKISYARIIKLIKKSKKRIKDINDPLILSGIAPLAHLPYNEQLKFKENVVKNLVNRNLNFLTIEKIKESPDTWNYRNKIKLICQTVNNKITCANYEKQTNFLVEKTSLDLAQKNIIDFLNIFLEKINNFASLKHNLEEIIIRNSFEENNLILVLKTKNEIDKKHLSLFLNNFQNLVQVYNTYSIKNKLRVKQIIYKKDFVDKINDLNFQINWNSFFQINNKQTSHLYKSLIDQMNFKTSDLVIDAFCGIGTIGLSVAKKVKKVIGFEIVPEAVVNAKNNAKINNIQNAFFIAGNVNKTSEQLKEEIDKLIVDPPREGIDKKFMSTILKLKPKEIGYISCNPHTFVRDAKILIDNEYELNYLKPFDMFPQTYHIELSAHFKRKK
ncbi:23S rRNA (uracil-5-)-methyltransferase RumA [Mycoplasmopsis columbina SF7]|uniref:23S rRNA (Uracil-5-)-methyltransferase RumA n=1 Tax=Mycoplasmopsis columbina SF7 TaxID=1037410 RepID=F9UKN4_9BACT|nr:23S rRNA (uracil(1939)-C(5))-methyltransferase RlmD [Mycoplasmopsis columbina]EGV00239.1 23S rRNA (uracil-5-)-methyltransferase RumA [Mycoplasmopsis columbina SF7]